MGERDDRPHQIEMAAWGGPDDGDRDDLAPAYGIILAVLATFLVAALAMVWL